MGIKTVEQKLGFSIDAGWVLPCLGFGSFLFVADTVNAPVLLDGSSGASLPTLLLSVLALAALATCALRRNWDKRWNPGIMVASALCISFYYVTALLFPAVVQHPALVMAIETASALGRAGLSFFWMVAILPLGSRRVSYIMTLSMCVFATFCLLIVLFKDSAAKLLLILLPVLSALCLQAFHRRRVQSFELSNPTKDEISVQSQEFLSGRANVLVYAAGILIPLVCGSAVLAFVHQTWPGIPTDYHHLFSAQMGLLIGALLLAAIQLVLVNFFWASANFMFASMVVPLLLMSMLLISTSEPSWATAYYALMLLVEKTLIALAVYSAYMFRLFNNWMAPWCIAFLCFHLGNLLGMSTSHFVSINMSLFVLIVIVAVYMASVCFATLYFGNKITQAYEGRLSGGFRGESRFRTAVDGLADAHGLTSREREILMELSRGRNAAYIAERLTISPQTAKKHQKNIYAKMELHSQQELIMLIDQAIEEPPTR